MKNFITLITLFLSLMSCDGDGILPEFLQFNKTYVGDQLAKGTVKGYAEFRNLSYGEDQRFHKFDMFRPEFEENPEPSVAIIMIHGGSWYFLDKGYNEGSVQLLKNKKKNLAIFNINLRLTQVAGITYQNQLQDIDLFIDFLNRNKKDYNLTGDYILWGYSSGGHLALTYSYMNRKNKNIKAVASVGAPTDLTDEIIRGRLWMDNRNLTELAVGFKYDENPDSFKKASPCYYVKKNLTPTILFYAGNDDVVPPVHGQLLADMLSQKKNKVALHKFEFDSHNMESMNHFFDLMLEFLKGVKD